MQTYSPANTAEMSEALKLCAARKHALAVVGGGTKSQLGRDAKSLQATVRTERMARVLEYAPSDMVIAVEAGCTLAALQATAAKERQRLAFDAPFAGRATIGGIINAGDFGPRRARYGGVRDLIIGITLVRADGTVAKSGGKVVKNVAGFDLPKVVCGSLGTLAATAEAIFRLHPLPESSATVLFAPLQAAQVVQLVARMRAAQLEPDSAVALRSPTGAYDLAVRFEGFGKGVQQQCARARELSPAEVLADAAAEQVWQRHDAVRTQGAVRLKMASLPSKLASLEPHLASIGGSFCWYATQGAGFWSGESLEPAALERLRNTLVSAGGSAILAHGPAALRDAVDPWGPLQSPALHERLKATFDPDRRLNPGRFAGGL